MKMLGRGADGLVVGWFEAALACTEVDRAEMFVDLA